MIKNKLVTRKLENEFEIGDKIFEKYNIEKYSSIDFNIIELFDLIDTSESIQLDICDKNFHPKILEILKYKNVVVHASKEVANSLNKYFNNIVIKEINDNLLYFQKDTEIKIFYFDSNIGFAEVINNVSKTDIFNIEDISLDKGILYDFKGDLKQSFYKCIDGEKLQHMDFSMLENHIVFNNPFYFDYLYFNEEYYYIKKSNINLKIKTNFNDIAQLFKDSFLYKNFSKKISAKVIDGLFLYQNNSFNEVKMLGEKTFNVEVECRTFDEFHNEIIPVDTYNQKLNFPFNKSYVFNLTLIPPLLPSSLKEQNYSFIKKIFELLNVIENNLNKYQKNYKYVKSIYILVKECLSLNNEFVYKVDIKRLSSIVSNLTKINYDMNYQFINDTYTDYLNVSLNEKLIGVREDIDNYYKLISNLNEEINNEINVVRNKQRIKEYNEEIETLEKIILRQNNKNKDNNKTLIEKFLSSINDLSFTNEFLNSTLSFEDEMKILFKYLNDFVMNISVVEKFINDLTITAVGVVYSGNILAIEEPSEIDEALKTNYKIVVRR